MSTVLLITLIFLTLNAFPFVRIWSGRWPWERHLLLFAFLFAVTSSPMARAVTPEPDGGYPGFNTAEGDNALFSLTTGNRTAFADTAAHSIEVLEIIDYASDVSTVSEHLNNRRDVVGAISGSDGTQGFIRFKNGRFAPLLVEPNDDGGGTHAAGINVAQLICGYYFNIADQLLHGFFFDLNKGYTEYQFGSNTWLFDLNDSGDFCGAYCQTKECTDPRGFVSVAGTVTPIVGPNAPVTYARGINNLGDVVGDYGDDNGFFYGFLRTADGQLIAPVDVPGGDGPRFRDINDKQIMVGSYTVASGERGFVLKLPDTVIIFDYPGATSTGLTGINNKNQLCGWFVEGARVHGVIARLK